jgi:hypothetical protein
MGKCHFPNLPKNKQGEQGIHGDSGFKTPHGLFELWKPGGMPLSIAQRDIQPGNQPDLACQFRS